MAITTLDGLLAGLQRQETFLKWTGITEAVGVMHSLLLSAGVPGAGTAPTPGMAGEAVTALSGMPSFVNPPGGQKAYLSRFAADTTIGGKIYLMDRLWHNSGISVTTTTAQTVDSVAFPARDNTGTINGEGVLVGLECYTGTNNGAAIGSSVISYTNSDGTSLQTGSFALSGSGSVWPATAVAGSFVPFLLAAGDRGIKSIQTVTLGTSYVTGAIGLVAYRPLVSLECTLGSTGLMADWSQLGLPELHANTSFWLLFRPLATTASQVWGQLQIAHG